MSYVTWLQNLQNLALVNSLLLQKMIYKIVLEDVPNTGGPPLVLIFGGRKTPHYMKSALFGDYFCTKTHEMGEIIFQSPLFEVFPSSQSSLFRNFQIHFVFKALSNYT